MLNTFVRKVKKQFIFLVTDYNFVISYEENSKRGPEIEGLVVYSSQTTTVTVHGENGGVGVGFGRVKDSIDRTLTAQTVHEYENLNANERALVLSHKLQDDRKARELVWSNKLQPSSRYDNLEQDVVRQLTDQACWLQRYADPFLRGDFSNWLEIYEYQIERMRAEYIRSGKDEFIQEIGLGEDGEPRVLGRQSTFQSSLDYLAQLRDEYGE